jgi:hypothetical protein
MHSRKSLLDELGSGIRWTARIWSIASILLILGFIIGEGLNPANREEWIGFLLFPVGISAGMILAWRKERLGGSVTAVSLLVFYLFHRMTAGSFPRGWGWLVFALPGFLFLIASISHRSGKESFPQASGEKRGDPVSKIPV